MRYFVTKNKDCDSATKAMNRHDDWPRVIRAITDLQAVPGEKEVELTLEQINEIKIDLKKEEQENDQSADSGLVGWFKGLFR